MGVMDDAGGSRTGSRTGLGPPLGPVLGCSVDCIRLPNKMWEAREKEKGESESRKRKGGLESGVGLPLDDSDHSYCGHGFYYVVG